jgi:hypothetical protein
MQRLYINCYKLFGRFNKILCIKACFFSDRTEEIFSPDRNFAATVQKFLSDRMKKYFSPYGNFLPTADILAHQQNPV